MTRASLALAALLVVPLAPLAARAADEAHEGTLTCAPNTACLVSVPGTITATIVGDSENWAVETATPTTVTVKPTAPRLRTNLILLTASDAFFVDLVAPASDERAAGTPRLAFAAKPSSPPPPMVQVLASPSAIAAPGPLSSAAAPSPSTAEARPVSIAYRWTTRRHPRITAVYDDGAKTYIRIRSDEAPALYALTSAGPEAVNYLVSPGPQPHEMTYTADRVSAKWLLTLAGKGRRAANLVIEQIEIHPRQSPAAVATPAAAPNSDAAAPAEN